MPSGKDDEDLYQRGLAHFRAGNYERSLQAIDQVLASDPHNGPALVLKGMALLELERPREAITALEQATHNNPDAVDGWSHLGIALMTEGKLREAADAFRAALRIRPDDVPLLTDLSNVLFMAGGVQEALETLQRARHVREGDLSILRNLAGMQVAAGDLDLALRTTEEMLQWNPEDVVARSDMAWLNYQLVRLDDASAAFRKLKETAPDVDRELYALHGLVMTDIKMQNWRRALQWAIEATRLDRYEFTTLMLRYISSKLFDQPTDVTEKELDERFEAEHREHRRLYAEVPVSSL